MVHVRKDSDVDGIVHEGVQIASKLQITSERYYTN